MGHEGGGANRARGGEVRGSRRQGARTAGGDGGREEADRGTQGGVTCFTQYGFSFHPIIYSYFYGTSYIGRREGKKL